MWRTYFSASWGPDNCTRLAMSCNDNVKNVWNVENIKWLKLDAKNFCYQAFMAYATLLLESEGKKQVEYIVITYKSTMRVESALPPKTGIDYIAHVCTPNLWCHYSISAIPFYPGHSPDQVQPLPSPFYMNKVTVQPLKLLQEMCIALLLSLVLLHHWNLQKNTFPLIKD